MTFAVYGPPLWGPWALGSAFIYIMLIACASANFASARGGAFTFDVSALPSDAWSNFGSANKYFKYKNKIKNGVYLKWYTPLTMLDMKSPHCFWASHRNLLEASVNGFFGYMWRKYLTSS